MYEWNILFPVDCGVMGGEFVLPFHLHGQITFVFNVHEMAWTLLVVYDSNMYSVKTIPAITLFH